MGSTAGPYASPGPDSGPFAALDPLVAELTQLREMQSLVVRAVGEAAPITILGLRYIWDGSDEARLGTANQPRQLQPLHQLDTEAQVSDVHSDNSVHYGLSP